MSALYF